MHSMFLPGLPLPALDEVQDALLYHTQLPGGSIGTVQRRNEVWSWRSLSGGRVQHGSRTELEAWLVQHA